VDLTPAPSVFARSGEHAPRGNVHTWQPHTFRLEGSSADAAGGVDLAHPVRSPYRVNVSATSRTWRWVGSGEAVVSVEDLLQFQALSSDRLPGRGKGPGDLPHRGRSRDGAARRAWPERVQVVPDGLRAATIAHGLDVGVSAAASVCPVSYRSCRQGLMHRACWPETVLQPLLDVGGLREAAQGLAIVRHTIRTPGRRLS
jgi:hypothetical protein